MAKINFGGVVQDARGKQNGIVYSKNRSGSYVKRKSSPTNPRTGPQTMVRSNFTALTKAYGHTLTQAERTSWIDFSVLWPRTDVFGNAVKISGQNMYISLGQRANQAGQTVLSTPPVDLTVTPIPIDITSLSLSVTGPTVAFEQTAAASGGTQQFYLFATTGLSAGRRPTKANYRFIGIMAAATTGFPASIDVSTLYTSVFGALILGTTVGLLVATIDTTTMAVAPGIQLVGKVAP